VIFPFKRLVKGAQAPLQNKANLLERKS